MLSRHSLENGYKQDPCILVFVRNVDFAPKKEFTFLVFAHLGRAPPIPRFLEVFVETSVKWDKKFLLASQWYTLIGKEVSWARF